MRAGLPSATSSWLAGVLACRLLPLLLLLSAVGCGTFSGTSSGRSTEAPDDDIHAKALARYAEGLLWESEPGHAADARRAFAEAARLDPDSRRPSGALVLSLLREGRAPEALDRLAEFCAEHPEDIAARRDLARLAEKADDPARAAHYYCEASALDPGDLTLAFSQVRTLFAASRDEEAVRVMRRLIHDRPCIETRNLPTFWAIQFCQGAQTPERAIPCLELAVASATGATQRAELHFFVGEAALAAGHTNDALRVFRQIQEQQPQHIRAATALANILHDRDGAAALAEQTAGTPPLCRTCVIQLEKKMFRTQWRGAGP